MAPRPAPLLTTDERRRLWGLAAVPLAFAVCAYVGQILSATLAGRAPALLIALTPGDAFLILTVNEMPTWVFFTVAFWRLVLPDPFLYRIGHQFGPAAKLYLERELGRNNRITRAVDTLDRWFPRVGPAIVFALPNYPVCLLSGITRLPVVPFAVLNAAGTLVRLYVIWRLGRLFSGPVEQALDTITRYQLPFTVVMVVLVMLQVGTSRRGDER